MGKSAITELVELVGHHTPSPSGSANPTYLFPHPALGISWFLPFEGFISSPSEVYLLAELVGTHEGVSSYNRQLRLA